MKTGIDWEKLANASGLTDVMGAFLPGGNLIVARAVVAALRDQGLAVVPRDDLEWANEWYWDLPGWAQQEEGQEGSDVYDRNRAALAAPGDGGKEPTDG